MMELSSRDRETLVNIIGRLKIKKEEILKKLREPGTPGTKEPASGHGRIKHGKINERVIPEIEKIFNITLALENIGFPEYFYEIKKQGMQLAKIGVPYEDLVEGIHLYEKILMHVLIQEYAGEAGSDGGEELEEVIGAFRDLQYKNLTTLISAYFEINKQNAYSQEMMYRNIIANANVAIIVIDPTDFRILETNKKGIYLTGYREEELLKKKITDIHPEDEINKAKGFFNKTFDEGSWASDKLHVMKKTGRIIPVNISANVVDYKGKMAIIAIFQDISEKRKLEQEFLEYLKELERSNRLKDLFTDIIRHDLLNPASIILNYTEILIEKKAGNIDELVSIKHNIERLIDMITTASKFAKVEAVKKLDFEREDLGSILKSVIQDFEPILKKKGMVVEYNAGDGEYFASVNPLVRDIFVNLISNAIKYSNEGKKIVIDIEDEKTDWKVMVKDFGEGILDQNKKGIFDRFTRIEKAGIKGTGLGLAIVKRLVELHKGEVWVEDNPEGGSIFFVRIPKTR